MNHGALQWAPMWVKHFVVTVWNRVNCLINGHDAIGVELYKHYATSGRPSCINCMAELKIDGKYVTEDELYEHDQQVQEQWEREMAERKAAGENFEWEND